MYLTNPKMYMALVPFSLNLQIDGAERPLSLNVERGDTLLFDGYRAQYRGHTGEARPLARTIGVWIQEVADHENPIHTEVDPNEYTQDHAPSQNTSRVPVSREEGRVVRQVSDTTNMAISQNSNTAEIAYASSKGTRGFERVEEVRQVREVSKTASQQASERRVAINRDADRVVRPVSTSLESPTAVLAQRQAQAQNAPLEAVSTNSDGSRTFNRTRAASESTKINTDGIEMRVTSGVEGASTAREGVKIIDGIEMRITSGPQDNASIVQSTGGIDVHSADSSFNRRMARNAEIESGAQVRPAVMRESSSNSDGIAQQAVQYDELNQATRVFEATLDLDRPDAQTPNADAAKDIGTARPKSSVLTQHDNNPEVLALLKAKGKTPVEKKAAKKVAVDPEVLINAIDIGGKTWAAAFWKDKVDFISSADAETVRALASRKPTGNILKALQDRAKALGIKL